MHPGPRIDYQCITTRRAPDARTVASVMSVTVDSPARRSRALAERRPTIGCVKNTLLFVCR